MWWSGVDYNGSWSGSVEYCEYSNDYSGSIKQGGITEQLSYTVPGWKYKICLRICNFSKKKDCELQFLHFGNHWPTLPFSCLNYGTCH